jgi:hypothetical protein
LQRQQIIALRTPYRMTMQVEWWRYSMASAKAT